MANGPEFFQTKMGHIFYEGTVPALVRELKRLNDNLERLQQAPQIQITTRPDPYANKCKGCFSEMTQAGYCTKRTCDYSNSPQPT